MADPNCDVLVVGGGASGLVAAVTAREAGARVILVERNAVLGGSTAWSVGSWTASGTEEQRRAGISDSADAHFEDLGKVAGTLVNRDNLALRRKLADETPTAFDWAKSIGVRFYGPLPEPPHRVPRMHMVLPNAKAYIYHLARKARAVGVEIRTETRVVAIRTENDRAVGVQTEKPSGELGSITVGRAVILAGGDYSNSAETKAALGIPHLSSVPGVNPTAFGECHRLVNEIGGEVVNGDLALGPLLRFVPLPKPRWVERLPPVGPLTELIKWALERLPRPIIRPFVMQFVTTTLGPERSLFGNGARLVNRRGEVIEIGDRTPGEALAAQPDNEAFIVFDAALAKRYSAWPDFISTAPGVAYAYLKDYRQARPDLYHEGADAAELASALGLSSVGLQRAFGSSGRLYALGPVKAYVVLTDGGVRVDDELRVVRQDGEVFVNLFAVGSTGQGGLLLEGHGHHIGWAFASGRIGGRNAAYAK